MEPNACAYPDCSVKTNAATLPSQSPAKRVLPLKIGEHSNGAGRVIDHNPAPLSIAKQRRRPPQSAETTDRFRISGIAKAPSGDSNPYLL